MKYFILFCLALAVPVTSAQAIESPFLRQKAAAYEDGVIKRNPFSTTKKQERFVRNALKKKHHAQENGYNGDEDDQASRQEYSGKKGKKKSNRKGLRSQKSDTSTLNE